MVLSRAWAILALIFWLDVMGRGRGRDASQRGRQGRKPRRPMSTMRPPLTVWMTVPLNDAVSFL